MFTGTAAAARRAYLVPYRRSKATFNSPAPLKKQGIRRSFLQTKHGENRLLTILKNTLVKKNGGNRSGSDG
jgi:hypothetical protein